MDSDAFNINGTIDVESGVMSSRSPSMPVVWSADTDSVTIGSKHVPSSKSMPSIWGDDSQSIDSSKDISLSDSQVTPTDDSQAEDSQASERLSQDDLSIGDTSRTPTNSAMLFPSFVEVDWPELSEPESQSNSECVSVSSEGNFGQLADRQAAKKSSQNLSTDDLKLTTSNNLHPAESFDEALNLQSTDSGIDSGSRPSELSLSSEGIRDEESPEGGLITSERTLLTMADTLTEICVHVMWKGVQGSDEAAWTVSDK